MCTSNFYKKFGKMFMVFMNIEAWLVLVDDLKEQNVCNEEENYIITNI
jgi:hypothetical protein